MAAYRASASQHRTYDPRIDTEHTSAGFFIQSDHFFNNFLGGKPPALALLDLVNVTTALGDEIVKVEHVELTKREKNGSESEPETSVVEG